jgi:predicted sulfurtransferase
MNRLSRASITFLTVLFLLAAIVVVSRSATVKASLQQTGSDGARRITPDEVRELLKKNQAVLIDVRGESAYKAGHIKGALWIAANEIGDRAKDLPRDKTIVTYCS